METPAIAEWIRLALRPHFHLGWNLFLALAPLVMALWLFRWSRRRGLLWWPVLAAFIAFLPNAAYTLTDTIHFVAEIRAEPMLPVWSVVYIVIPKYLIFVFLGFQSHVLCLILVGGYLGRVGGDRWVLSAELVLNFLCAIGVFWGRYLRLNSWDLVTDPQSLASLVIDDMVTHDTWSTIAWFFCVITLGYYLLKMVDLALWQYWTGGRPGSVPDGQA